MYLFIFFPLTNQLPFCVYVRWNNHGPEGGILLSPFSQICPWGAQSTWTHLTFWPDWIRLVLLCNIMEKMGRWDFCRTAMLDLVLFDYLGTFCASLFDIYGANPIEAFLEMYSVQGRSGWQWGTPCKHCTMQGALLECSVRKAGVGRYRVR